MDIELPNISNKKLKKKSDQNHGVLAHAMCGFLSLDVLA
jgi:hypothetical protein